MSDLFPETAAPLKKHWIRADLLEDTIPSTEDSLDGWIVANKEKFWMRGWSKESPDFNFPLTEGQIVKFAWTAILARGTVKVTLDANGKRQNDLSINFPTAPEGTTMFIWDGADSDTQSDNLDDFTDGMDSGDETDVVFYVWSDDISFIFRAGAFAPTATPTAPEST